MCGAEDENRGADASQFCGEASQARSVQGKSETDSSGQVKSCLERVFETIHIYIHT